MHYGQLDETDKFFRIFRNILNKKRRLNLFRFRSLEGKVDVIVGLDARGFLFGPIMAAELEIPFVPVKVDRSLPENDTGTFSLWTHYVLLA